VTAGFNAGRVVERWADSRIQFQWPSITGSCALSCVKVLKFAGVLLRSGKEGISSYAGGNRTPLRKRCWREPETLIYSTSVDNFANRC
jgi:hypothetical protein